MLNLGRANAKKNFEVGREIQERSSSINQPDTTYCGSCIQEVPSTLPYYTQSLCPECLTVIQARKFIEDNMVWMEKTCTQHGYYKELLAPDAQVYMNTFSFRFGDGRGLSNPLVKDATKCPTHCGICNMHQSHTALANLDLTNRCDMCCPVCFANANALGYVCEPDLAEIRQMMLNLRNMKPVPAKVVQFSGGEPTLHPQFFKILEMAKEVGFWHVQIASNGKNMANFEFAQKAQEAGLNTIYLQFDGVTQDVYIKTRAENVLEVKYRAIENARKLGMRVVLVPTMVKGVNDHQVGDIVRFAIANVDTIVGIAFQPVCFTGRINEKNRLEKRYTMTHLAMDIEKQTGFLNAKKDWFSLACMSPLSKLAEALSGEPAMTITCHPDCGSGAYLFVEPLEKKEVSVLTDFFDLRSALIDIQALATQIQDRNKGRPSSATMRLFSKAKTLNIIRKYFNAKKAPKSLSFMRLLGVMDGYRDKEISKKTDHQTNHGYPTLFVAGMHFQDPYNFDIARVKRCNIHYSARDNRVYPFCTYNSGPCYRDKIETSISVPLETYARESAQNRYASQLPESQVKKVSVSATAPLPPTA